MRLFVGMLFLLLDYSFNIHVRMAFPAHVLHPSSRITVPLPDLARGVVVVLHSKDT
jgi:hypothetical protein